MKSSDDRRQPGSPAQWIAHAESDLQLARVGGNDPSILREQLCFHAQQAAEKALKAVLILKNVEFPFTHDIASLIKIGVAAGVQMPQDIRRAAHLTPYAAETRYPGGWGEIGSADVEEALDIAGRVISWAKQFLADKKKEI
jgi:HEPN domain-containing protein